MIKKFLLSLGALITGLVATVGLVLAQTSSPSPSPTVSPTPTASPTASPATRVPTGAPATGMGGY